MSTLKGYNIPKGQRINDDGEGLISLDQSGNISASVGGSTYLGELGDLESYYILMNSKGVILPSSCLSFMKFKKILLN